MKTNIAKISKILGNETNLKVILCLENGKKSFNKIKKECKVCPPSLVYSLKILTKEKIAEKTIVSKRPKRAVYSLTRKGKKLLKIIKKLRL